MPPLAGRRQALRHRRRRPRRRRRCWRSANETAAHRADDIGRQQVEGANLALTMHLRGRKRTVPLRLPSKVIAALAQESQLREMSLGQLVGDIVAGALADGLSGLLDDDPPSADAA
jgi:hypothetical protein